MLNFEVFLKLLPATILRLLKASWFRRRPCYKSVRPDVPQLQERMLAAVSWVLGWLF